jgi:Tol biopolymer transport system component
MPLSPGTKLGPYSIAGPLGAGGMGEVYRARDTRLDRTVAIKVLPAHLSGSPDVKQRFEREARAISSLNHPHICTLHDVGSQDGVDYLVMEYVEGETLAARLKKGPLPLDQALPIAIDVAEALDRAHRAGITHRDLKPGNIMLAKDGAKVLDFGLAKIGERGVGASAGAAGMQTITTPLTGQGAIVGTLQYMAPEQLEGKEADARSDIFAFGTVIYEMVTGRRAFEAKSEASLIAAILEHEPTPIAQLQPLSPRLLDRLVRDCLAKDPDQRRQTAHDVLLDLKWIASAGMESQENAATRRRDLKPWFAAALAVALAVVALLWMLTRPRATERTTRLQVTLPAGDYYGGSWWWLPTLALAPDGSRLAYVATHDGVTQLYLRNMGEWEGHPLPGTVDAHTPFFSPDGAWLGAIVQEKIIKIPVSGGPPVTVLTQASNVYGACWAPDGNIYFASEEPGGLSKVSANGGTPQIVTTIDIKARETDHRFPEMLPGGEALLFTVRNGDEPNFDEADIQAVSLKTGARKMIVKSGTNPRYLPNGYLLFLRAGVLFAAPFDPVKLELKGQPTPVVDGVIENPRIGAGQFAVSADGSLVYIPGGVTFGDHELVFVDHSGNTRVLTSKKRPYEDFSISPDGRFIATTIEGPVTDTWIHDIVRDTETRFTFGVEHRDPAWSADGKRVAYSGYRDGKFTIDWKTLDGSGPEEQLVASDYAVWPWFFSRDGRVLLYVVLNPTNAEDIWILPLEGDRKPRPLFNSRFSEEWAQTSPDDHWVAYNSDESGRPEVYVTPFPGPGPKLRVSTEGGRHPQWSPNGRELYYRVGASSESQRALGQNSKIMAVSIETAPELKAGTPHLLFQGPFFDSGHDYAVTPDGKGFIFIRETPPVAGASQLKVVLHWFDELKHRAVAENQ